jgi:subtilisin family serine protease
MIYRRLICGVTLMVAFGGATPVCAAGCTNFMYAPEVVTTAPEPIEELESDDGSARYYYNEQAAEMHGVRRLTQLQRVYGDKSIVGVWDAGGVYGGHEQLKSRVIRGNNAACASGTYCFDQHATHVAGTVGSKGELSAHPEIEKCTDIVGNAGTLSQGMAPLVTIRSYKRVASTPIVVREVCLAGSEHASYISNHSYGWPFGWYPACIGQAGSTKLQWQWFGDNVKYDEDASKFDDLVHQNPKLIVFRAAGNSRNKKLTDDYYCMNKIGIEYCNFENHQQCITPLPQGIPSENRPYAIITSNALAKNVITIGAIEKPLTIPQEPGQLKVITPTKFSSFGPGPRGEIKPDLVAAGVRILSPSIRSKELPAGSSQLIPNFYLCDQGTSMASPVSAGAAVLLNEVAERKTGQVLNADEMKAILIHTAFSENGPNYETGWGAIQADYAGYILDPRTAATNARTERERSWIAEYEKKFPKGFLWPRDQTNTPFYRRIEHIPGAPVRITLVWLDRPGPILNDDLDLKVWDSKGLRQGVWCKYNDVSNEMIETPRCEDNRVDTVEQVDVRASDADGVWDLRVTHKKGQKVHFALVVSGFRNPFTPRPDGIDMPSPVVPTLPNASGLCHACYDFSLRDAPYAESPPQVTVFRCDPVRVLKYDPNRPSWAYVRFRFPSFHVGFPGIPPGPASPWNRGWAPRSAIACQGDGHRCGFGY